MGESSITRVARGADASVHNIIESVSSPMATRIAKERGYRYRNDGAPGPVPVLSPQQLQVTKTSLDPRLMRIERDVANLLKRASQTSQALNGAIPRHQDVGAVHLRLTIPVPTTATIEGFETLGGDDLAPEAPLPAGEEATYESESDSDVSTRVAGTRRQRRDTGAEPYPGSACGPRPDSDSSDDDDSIGSDVDPFFLNDPPRCEWLGMRFEDGRRLGEWRIVHPLGLLGNALQVRAHFDRWRNIGPQQMVRNQCDFCNWAAITPYVNPLVNFAKDLMRRANPSGAKDLYVMDVMLPTDLFVSCIDTADRLIGEDKPAKNLHMQMAQRKLRRIISRNVDQSVHAYLETITNLVTMAVMLDTGSTGKDHCSVTGYSGTQTVFSDFFAASKLEEAVEQLAEAKKEAGHPVEGIVLAVPAPEMKGELDEHIVMVETAELVEYELSEKKDIVGAVQVGVDLLGKPPPNDHKNPLNFVGAVYRHMGNSTSVVAEGTPDEYIIHLDRSKKAQLTPEHERVWEDIISMHSARFAALLSARDQRLDFDFLDDGRPCAYSAERYEAALDAQLADETFFTQDNALTQMLRETRATCEAMQKLKATANLKKGEDSSRARATVCPGVCGTEALHQARTSPLIKALEAMHAINFNHTNLKGLTEDTKRIRFAEFLRAVPKGGIVFGTDKSKNDSCFREPVWKKCVRYLARMNEIFEHVVVSRAYVYNPNEAFTPEAFPTGCLNLKYWTVQLTPALAFLLSGIGPTSFVNRMESTVENGASVLAIYGELAYQKWMFSELNGLRSEHPAWNLHPLPHVAEIVEWAPLSPLMVADTKTKVEELPEEKVFTPHLGLYEGDDQGHAIIPPWSGLSVRETVMKYTSVLSRTTGFIFEPALTADEMDMVGHNSVFEMLSAWTSLPSGKSDEYEVAVIVPKVLKAIRKLPHCTISSQHTLTYDEHGTPQDVVRDAKFWSLALTKFYALAIINHESLGVRGLFLSHGDYCYDNLERLLGKNAAYTYETTYGDRDPEKKQIEEVSATTYDHCGVMREQAHDLLASVSRERVMRTCVAAWRSELPDLALQPKEAVAESLRAFDTTTMSVEITDQHISDPMLLWQELDIGCILEPLTMYASGNLAKVAEMYRSEKLLADSTETVQLARKYASAKPTRAAGKEGGSDTAAGPLRGGKAKGEGKSKGAKGATAGKGKASRPAGKPGPARDTWWRAGWR